ncbi:MAG: ATP-binding cassette domain-containing protein, partial [Anaerolineae bacterium]
MTQPLPQTDTPQSPILEVRGLSKTFVLGKSLVKQVLGRPPVLLRAVRKVDLLVYPGETLGLVGESGCGKSITAMSIMRLIQEPPGKIVSGEILLRSRTFG